MESQGKRLCFPLPAFHFQWSNHHVQGGSEEGFHPSLYDLGLEQSKADALLHHDQLIHVHLQRSPTGTFLLSLCPLSIGDDHAQPAGKQSCHSYSRPWRGEAVYLTLTDNVNQPADSASPQNQRDPSYKIGLIGHHKEYRILIIPCDTRHLHTQYDKPERASACPA